VTCKKICENFQRREDVRPRFTCPDFRSRARGLEYQPTLVFGVVVVIAGYQDGIAVTSAMQDTVWVGLTLVPALSCLLSAVPFWFYRLGGATKQR
jgi:hypothetical protein